MAADPFSPGWCLQPGLKVPNKTGLVVSYHYVVLQGPLAPVVTTSANDSEH
jgi:hypothetical protein